jgi:hypothetical protein
MMVNLFHVQVLFVLHYSEQNSSPNITSSSPDIEEKKEAPKQQNITKNKTEQSFRNITSQVQQTTQQKVDNSIPEAPEIDINAPPPPDAPLPVFNITPAPKQTSGGGPSLNFLL